MNIINIRIEKKNKTNNILKTFNLLHGYLHV